MRTVKIICDAFAICDDDKVIAVITKCNDSQWGIFPLVRCKPIGVAQFIPLHHALEEGMKLQVVG